ncbi:MAG: hypothetical protein PHO66_01460 [Eubacteriales bacterium]|nr:hypothetical protein [Eubacteriales bacterium]
MLDRAEELRALAGALEQIRRELSQLGRETPPAAAAALNQAAACCERAKKALERQFYPIKS